MTLLAVSAFRGAPMRHDFTITGTINRNGQIGQVGGVTDKVSATAAAGLDLILVPAAGQDSLVQGTYYIAQSEYRIPIVEVSNISQAAAYAFGNSSGVANEVTLNFSADYMVSGLSQAQLTCSNGCDEAPFSAFTNYTLDITKIQVASLSNLPGLGAVAGQLADVAGQASALHQKSYLYISADIAFLDYLNAFYFGSYNVTREAALGRMQDVQTECSSLIAPPLTLGNYEYVIGAELRKGWANYTINSTISDYNATGATGDDILSSMYSTGEAQAWCGASSFLYNYQYSGNSTPVTPSRLLAQTAFLRINRAAPYPGMYLTLARQAYKEGDYPVAIIDADYAYVISSAGQTNATTPQLINDSIALAHNSTYGVWATEFSKEALFYAYEASSSNNSDQAQSYAYQAYTSAYLASQIGNDTRNIHDSFAVQQTSVGSSSSLDTYGPAAVYLLDGLVVQVQQLIKMIGIMLALLVGCIALVVMLMQKVMVISAKLRGERKDGKKAR